MTDTETVAAGLLAPVRAAPGARYALPPDELEARLAEYGRRAALRLPLFQPGGPVPPDPPVCCGGCGLVPPKRTFNPGWRAPLVPGFEWMRVRVVYCPACLPLAPHAE